MFATLAGSFPYPPGDQGAALREVLEAQVAAGLALLSDGRVHALDGDAPDRLVAEWRAAAAAAAEAGSRLPVKLAIEGPWAAAGRLGLDAATEAGRTALRALAEDGCRIVEVHEPAADLPRDPVDHARFAQAHRAMLADAESLHACLAITGGSAEPLGDSAVYAAPYRSHLFDLIAGPDSWRVIAVAPPDRGIIVGVVDATGVRKVGLEEITWAAHYAAALGGRGLERVGIAPSGGLAEAGAAVADAAIALLGEVAALLAGDSEALLRRMDPRAIDPRSAALGEYRPDRRSRPGG